MGIKGIYGEIGPGERIALSKIAAEHFERYRRPIRIAIDISIWNFQIQSGKGGSNPALRTLYYRLLRLLSLSIQPLFIFDGANKPPFKRNVKTAPHTASLPNVLTKQMLKLFGFPFHTAPGEAEAECALLQKERIVDAVLSEDVDTLMFGSGLTMRNWSSEGTRGNKSPTHVNIYKAQATKNGKSGLDSDGMILVALMSGGDYVPAGIPGCGIKVACQAARAGFGTDLCKLSRTDSIGLRQFRERLEYELRTNESGFFRTRHKALHIPDSFPDQAVLGYYTHPAVSSKDKLVELRETFQWNGDIDILGLRNFVAQAFEWQAITGAKKFVRGLAPALLVHKLLQRGMSETETGDLEVKEAEEASLITALCGRRKHFINDGMPELRTEYTPLNIVGLDLSKEDSDQNSFEYESQSNGEDQHLDGYTPSHLQGPIKRRAPFQYDPTQLEKIWILETYAKMGVPLMVETWEEDMLKPKKPASKKPASRKPASRKPASRKPREKAVFRKGGMKPGALDAFIKVTKSGVHAIASGSTTIKPPHISQHPPALNVTPLSSAANRRLIFENQPSPAYLSPASTSSSLPSPSTLISPRAKPLNPDASPHHNSSIFRSTSKRSRRLIALRESLEGAWKRVGVDEAGRSTMTYKSVAVVDLTTS